MDGFCLIYTKLVKIVEKICLTFEGIAYENSVEISSNIQKDIMFKCNKDEIQRLISIILDNAIKHSYEKTVINVDMKKDKNNIKISITNHGEPIKPGDEQRIFERFYRVDKARKRDKNQYNSGNKEVDCIINYLSYNVYHSEHPHAYEINNLKLNILVDTICEKITKILHDEFDSIDLDDSNINNLLSEKRIKELKKKRELYEKEK